MKKIGLPLIAYSVLSFSTNVSSEILDDFYLSANIAVAQHKTGVDGFSGDLSDNATSFSLAGGYMFNYNFGIELAYVGFGEGELMEGVFSSVSSEASAWTVSSILTTGEMENSWEFFVKAGVAKWSHDYIYEIAFVDGGLIDDFELTDDDSGMDPFGGFGVSYHIATNFKVDFTADYYIYNPTFSFLADESDVQNSRYGLGISYLF